MRRTVEWLVDAWVPAALVVGGIAEVTTTLDDPAGRTALLSVLVPLALVTGLRRRAPQLAAPAATVLVGVLVLGVLDDPRDQPPLVAFLSLLIVLFGLGLHGTGRVALGAGVASAAGLLGLQVVSWSSGQSAGDVVPSVVFLTGAWVMGHALGTSRRQARLERERARRADEERAAHAAAATLAERGRIARELHDVIAHALTGIVVQASVEARMLPDGDAAARTLRLVEERGRAAMVELRLLLGLLREDGQGATAAPLPSLRSIDPLLARVREAGHEVVVTGSGDATMLPAAIDLAGYRLLQESLTNVVRHAPGAAVQVSVTTGAEELRLRVRNAPSAATPTILPAGGAGLAGMRERVRVYGGRFEAGPTPDGGFVVRATLPTSVPGSVAGRPAVPLTPEPSP